MSLALIGDCLRRQILADQEKILTFFVNKRPDRQIVLRFGMAEVRINAGTNELCDRLIEAFRDLKVQRVSHSETLQVSVAFAVVEQAKRNDGSKTR